MFYIPIYVIGNNILKDDCNQFLIFESTSVNAFCDAPSLLFYARAYMFSYYMRPPGLSNLFDKYLLQTTKCFPLLEICINYVLSCLLLKDLKSS